MTDLKTLKDINHIRMSTTRSEGKTTFDVNVDVLRHEAIKWIKKLEMHNDIKKDNRLTVGELELAYNRYEQDDFFPVIKFLKYFFNVTDEDLQ